MAGVPSRIEELARDTARIADPETALRALTALRRELDDTEPELVQRALGAGASWSQIARALGITKQAAHRKYRNVFEQAFSAPVGGGKILVSPRAREAIQFAREEAVRLGQPAVGTEHILLGILRCQENPAVQALGAVGVTLDAARDCLRTTLPGLGGAGSDSPPYRRETVTASGRRTLERSLREALKRGADQIEIEHLLLALLADSRHGAVQTLEVLKATPSAVKRRLEHQLAPPATITEVTPVAPVVVRAVQTTSRRRPVSTS
jgi:ATP-dependent Clp protease ATP-binding subunit ClpA